MQYKVIINNYQKGAKLRTTPIHKIVSQNTIGNNRHEIIYDLDSDREKEFIEKVFNKKLIPVTDNFGYDFDNDPDFYVDDTSDYDIGEYFTDPDEIDPIYYYRK